MIGKEVKKWGFLEIVLVIVGTVLVYWVTVAAPSQGSEHLLMVFVAGVIGVSALMLPGLSGSFVLLLMGNVYHHNACGRGKYPSPFWAKHYSGNRIWGGNDCRTSELCTRAYLYV